MNNKSQTLGIAIMTSIFILIIGLMCVNFLMPEITTARTNLNCSGASAISDGTKLLCTGINTIVIYWIVIIFSIVIGGIVYKFK